jgi:hypothetical protein
VIIFLSHAKLYKLYTCNTFVKQHERQLTEHQIWVVTAASLTDKVYKHRHFKIPKERDVTIIAGSLLLQQENINTDLFNCQKSWDLKTSKKIQAMYV